MEVSLTSNGTKSWQGGSHIEAQTGALVLMVGLVLSHF